MRAFKSIILVIFLLILVHELLAQDSTEVSSSGIKVAARVSSKEVPLNRSLQFIIQVEWFGDLRRFEISEVENPEVRNFKIMSNASSDRRELVNDQPKAIKTFEFELIPEELGMGYIEGTIIKYIDTESGEGKHLITNRLSVVVIDPVPEHGSKTWLLKWILLAFLIGILFTSFFIWKRKKDAEKRKKAEEEAFVPLEDFYLAELKRLIQFDAHDFDIKVAYSELSLLFRKYLSEKFNFSATNEVKEEIIHTLEQNNVSESLINNTEEILSTCDVVKFSGSSGDKSGLERIYTLVEDFFKT